MTLSNPPQNQTGSGFDTIPSPTERLINPPCNPQDNPPQTLSERVKETHVPPESNPRSNPFFKESIKTKYTEADFECASQIFQSFDSAYPYTQKNKPNLNQWADTVRLIREQDGHTHPEILALARFAAADHAFWFRVVRDVKALRRNWDKLAMKRDGPRGKPDLFLVPPSPERMPFA
jgi:hypothetical protein